MKSFTRVCAVSFFICLFSSAVFSQVSPSLKKELPKPLDCEVVFNDINDYIKPSDGKTRWDLQEFKKEIETKRSKSDKSCQPVLAEISVAQLDNAFKQIITLQKNINELKSQVLIGSISLIILITLLFIVLLGILGWIPDRFLSILNLKSLLVNKVQDNPEGLLDKTQQSTALQLIRNDISRLFKQNEQLKKNLESILQPEIQTQRDETQGLETLLPFSFSGLTSSTIGSSEDKFETTERKSQLEAEIYTGGIVNDKVSIFNQIITEYTNEADQEDAIFRAFPGIKRMSLANEDNVSSGELPILKPSNSYGYFYCLRQDGRHIVLPVPSKSVATPWFPSIFDIAGRTTKVIHVDKPAYFYLDGEQVVQVEKGRVST